MKESPLKRRAIGIFAKKPEPGRVKTRLSPPFSSVEAAELYSEMLKTVIFLFSLEFRDVYLFFTGGNEYFNETYPQYQQIEQRGDDLGMRIDNAINDLLSRGYDEVGIVGSDSPDLPVALVKKAFEQLENNRSVLIPTDDGGYAFIGASGRVSPLFRNIEWSTARVLDDTTRQAQYSEISLSVVEPWTDIDDINDVRAYIERASNSPLAQFILNNYSRYL